MERLIHFSCAETVNVNFLYAGKTKQQEYSKAKSFSVLVVSSALEGNTVQYIFLELFLD